MSLLKVKCYHKSQITSKQNIFDVQYSNFSLRWTSQHDENRNQLPMEMSRCHISIWLGQNLMQDLILLAWHFITSGSVRTQCEGSWESMFHHYMTSLSSHDGTLCSNQTLAVWGTSKYSLPNKLAPHHRGHKNNAAHMHSTLRWLWKTLRDL